MFPVIESDLLSTELYVILLICDNLQLKHSLVNQPIAVITHLLKSTYPKHATQFNPLKGRDINWLHFAIQV